MYFDGIILIVLALLFINEDESKFFNLIHNLAEEFSTFVELNTDKSILTIDMIYKALTAYHLLDFYQ